MKLKPFQEIGRDFLAARTRALLADQMRLGKTVQAIAAMQAIDAHSALVVCPAVARTVWKMEFERFGWAPQVVQIRSYDQVRMNPQPYLDLRWSVLVVDESHYIKNHIAARSRAVLGKAGVARRAKHVWCLSGTPAPNHAGELWTLLRAFGVTGMTRAEFADRYCYFDDAGQIRGTRGKMIPELRALLAPVMLRRTKDEVASELPALGVEPWYLDAKPAALDAAVDRQLRELSGAELLAWLQNPANAAHLSEWRINTALAKVPAVAAALAFELENRLIGKTVVFGYHREPIRALADALARKSVYAVQLHGGTSPTSRETAMRSFAAPGGAQVFIGQILAAGTAIDLSSAHQGVLLERDWVPGNNAQALERMGGFRQRHPVTVRDAIIPGGADEIVANAVARKLRELTELFKPGGNDEDRDAHDFRLVG